MDAEQRLWNEIEKLHDSHRAATFLLGKKFLELKNLYSERANSGGHRLSSGKGVFEKELKARGFKPRTVRGWINDFVAISTGEGQTEAAKRAARRSQPRISDRTTENSDLEAFAAILPYTAALAAFREAAKIYHPGHGGSGRKMQELNALWDRLEPLYKAREVFAVHLGRELDERQITLQ